MNIQLLPLLKGTVYLSIVFVLVSLSIFLLSLRTQTEKTFSQTNASMIQLVKDVDDVKLMTNATLFQAEEVLHHADIVLATEGQSQTQQLHKVNTALDQLTLTIKHIDVTQESVNVDVHSTLISLQEAVKQAKETLAETQKTVNKTGEAIDSVNVLTTNLQPTVQHINETTDNLGKMSDSLNKVVTNATEPKPWYKKIVGYIWAPIKIASIFAK